MTETTFKRLLCRIPTGEYKADPWEIYKLVCSKSYKNMNIWANYQRRTDFCWMFIEKSTDLKHLPMVRLFTLEQMTLIPFMSTKQMAADGKSAVMHQAERPKSHSQGGKPHGKIQKIWSYHICGR